MDAKSQFSSQAKKHDACGVTPPKTDIFLYSSKDSSRCDQVKSQPSLVGQDNLYWKVNAKSSFKTKPSLSNYRFFSKYQTKTPKKQMSALNSTQNDTNQSHVENTSQPAIVGDRLVKIVSITLAKARSNSSRKISVSPHCSKRYEPKESSMAPVANTEASKTLSIDSESYGMPQTTQARFQRKITFGESACF